MEINTDRLLSFLQDLIETPSVVGYPVEIHEKMSELLGFYGYLPEFDRRQNLYVRVKGKDSSHVRMLGAHLDTIGLVVRGIDDNGWLKVRQLGGVNYHSLENENVYVHTRGGTTYTGMLICEKHSVHVFEDARDVPRDENTMRILLDEDVHSREEVKALGIQHGDLVSIEPRFVKAGSGYIKSRHLDDKAQVAALLECLALLQENHLQPAWDTWFVFPIYEEIGLGGAWVPEEVEEYAALDIGLTGPDQEGSEKKVSICAADRVAPYDWELTGRLISLAENAGLDPAVDVFFHYSSDATAAMRSANNVRHALFGAGCMNSHSYERTHIDGIRATVELAMEYILAD